MYDLRSLKSEVKHTEHEVECPVKGCTEMLPRMRGTYFQDPKFMCPIHRIIVTPSTFTYEEPMENILWKTEDDLELYVDIAYVKRDKFRKIGHNNSEDAVSWNVFRCLERNGWTASLITQVLGKPVENPHIIYWTYDQKSKTVWKPLEDAWNTFELVTSGHRSEPDIIVRSGKELVFIEAKLKSGNDITILPERADKVREGYVTSANYWFSNIFNFDFDTIALESKKYELMRFWIIGTWIAKQHGWNFTLLNLVRDRQEKQIEKQFGKFLKTSDTTHFKRYTWEKIFNYLSGLPENTQDKNTIIEYFENRTLGYYNGKIIKAFSF
jgi:Holliday junction resolvase-like predicted endonuclease